MIDKNHSADDYIKFKPKKLGKPALGNKTRKKGECEICGDDSQRLIKGKCPKCYGDGVRQKKRTKTNPLFHPQLEKKAKKKTQPKAICPVQKPVEKPRYSPRPAVKKADPNEPYVSVSDIRRRPIGDFTKAQAEEFFNLKWESISSFLRTGRPVHGLYRISKYVKPS